jgi:hypothetical protein
MTIQYSVIFEVLTAVIIKDLVFWDVTPYILVDIYQDSKECSPSIT